MKTIHIILFLVLVQYIGAGEQAYAEAPSSRRIPFRDSCSIVAAWTEQPEVPYPTLDHHLGKVTASVGVFSVLSLSGVKRETAGYITSWVALSWELIQVLFFNETPVHAINDMVLYSYHWSEYFMLKRKYVIGATLTVTLTGLYLELLPCK